MLRSGTEKMRPFLTAPLAAGNRNRMRPRGGQLSVAVPPTPLAAGNRNRMRLFRIAALAAALAVAAPPAVPRAAGTAAAQDPVVAPAPPRVAPISPDDPAAWTGEVRAGLASFGGDPERATNLLRALARHPPALRGLGPLAAYLRRRTMVPAVDQLLMGLRAAWLCRSEATWAELAAEARGFGLGDADLRRVAEGPDAGWGPWDGLMLRAMDELHRDAFLSDASWDELATRYNAPQLVDTIFGGAEFVLLATLANALGVRPDERFADRLPAGVERAAGPVRAAPARLGAPRLDPLPRGAWSDEVRGLLDPGGAGRPVSAFDATLARHPALLRPWAVRSAYVRSGSTLSGRARGILILRSAWLGGSESGWSRHVEAARRAGMTGGEIRRVAAGADAPGRDPFEAALLRAADELHRGATVSDATWAALAARYGAPELIDVVITAAAARTSSIVLNSLGVPPAPGGPRFPDAPR